MNYRGQIAGWQENAKKRGLRASLAYSRFDRLLAKCGFELPPAILWRPRSMVMVFGLVNAAFFELCILLVYLTGVSSGLSFLSGLVFAMLGGVINGVLMTVYFYTLKRKYKLSTWENFKRECSD